MSEEKNRFSVLKENTFKKKSTRNNFKKKDEKSSSNNYHQNQIAINQNQIIEINLDVQKGNIIIIKK